MNIFERIEVLVVKIVVMVRPRITVVILDIFCEALVIAVIVIVRRMKLIVDDHADD